MIHILWWLGHPVGDSDVETSKTNFVAAEVVDSRECLTRMESDVGQYWLCVSLHRCTRILYAFQIVMSSKWLLHWLMFRPLLCF